MSTVTCCYVLACSAALLELFPETYNIMVRLATSEWKILVRQISYENRESGSPILAIFVSGSLCASLVCFVPLQNLTFIIAGSQLCAGILRAFYFLYSPFRPKSSHSRKNLKEFYYLSKRAKAWNQSVNKYTDPYTISTRVFG
jgi:glucan phosphoethanolaminetransferase (alkaline phosphatase superfamily)